MDGEIMHLWRAIDQDGTVLDILVQNRRDKVFGDSQDADESGLWEAFCVPSSPG